MKIALVQMTSGSDKKVNIKKAVSFVKTAAEQGARFILLPEVYNYRGPNDLASLAAVAEDIPGPSTIPFLQIAKENNVHILTDDFLLMPTPRLTLTIEKLAKVLHPEAFTHE